MILVGRAVQVGRPRALERFLEFLVVVLAAVEHQVLEQVGESGVAGPLVLGPDVVPHVHRHDGRLVVLVHDDGQPVGQDEALVRDVDGRLSGEGDRAGQQAQCRDDVGGAKRHNEPHWKDDGAGMVWLTLSQ